MKPILFNTDMVRGLLDCRKTVTRRIVKAPVLSEVRPPDRVSVKDGTLEMKWTGPEIVGGFTKDAPYKPGDILYVRETWLEGGGTVRKYLYKAGLHENWWKAYKWRPSIHMPKEAARIFLRVTDVRVERLQEIIEEQALAEGVPGNLDYPISPVYCPTCQGEGTHGALGPNLGYTEVDCGDCNTAVKRFSHLWDSTIKPADRYRYGWAANPWVWVIQFERIAKEEAAR